MKSRLGHSEADPIMRDIVEAAIAGHFDARREEGPSRLEQESSFALLERVRMMSDARRKLYLAQIGRVRHGMTRLAGKREISPRRARWLSGGDVHAPE